jgi:monomeric sarcosine oxidase
MRVVVVGAGVFGSWTAYHLLESGVEVTLVDAYGPGNSRSSSGDETRILRCGYGRDRLYSELASRSLEQWRALDARAGGDDRVWHRCGVLWMAAGDDPYTEATRATLDDLGSPCDVLDRDALARRFPEIDCDGIRVALFEPECGVVMARRAVRALAGELERRGVRLVRARVKEPTGRSHGYVETTAAARLDGDRFVFACGAWLPSLFPSLLRLIRPTRQVVTYFGTPAGDERFRSPRWPAWIDFPAGIYGTPDLEGRGIKVGIDEHGPPIDPDTADRLADSASVEKARAWLRRRVPRLADSPVVETRVCQYENTSTGDFLIDRHPAHDNVWIAGGGSGHGFKHGPAVGEVVARMVLDDGAPHERFALAHKTAEVRRTVF